MEKYRLTGPNQARCFRSALAGKEEFPTQEGLVIRARFMALSSFLRQFLQKFYAGSKKQFDSKSGELLTLTRFIYYGSHYSSGRPKPAAFLPRREENTISMLFIDSLQDQQLWNVGDEIGEKRGRSAIARADMPKSRVVEAGLLVALTPGPHPNHADASGWPDGKDERKAIALELCAASALHIRSSASNIF